MSTKLSIGLLIDNDHLPAWQYEMLFKIQNSDYAEIKVIIENNTKRKKQSFFTKFWNNKSQLGLLLFSFIENKLVKVNYDAFEKKNIGQMLNGVTKIKVTPERTRHVDRFSENDILKIQRYEIDVFIRLGFRILKGDILKIAKSGIWSYHHGDNDVNRGRPPGMWEFLEKWETTGITLQILTEDLDNGRVLYKSYAATNTNSWKRNKNNLYWNGVSILPRKLEELHQIGRESFFQKVDKENKDLKFYSNRLYKNPRVLELFLKLVFRYLSITWNRLIGLFYYNQWILMYKFSNGEEPSRSIYQFKKLIPPKNKFWADPFVYKTKGEYYIFFEEFLYPTKKGHISVLKIDRNGTCTEPEIALSKHYHLSYPFLWEEDGTLYMIPESRANNSIELYKCVVFPNKWELEKTLMDDVQAVDTTIVKKDGTYWMFTNIRENKGASTADELFLFSSKHLISDSWTPHPQNPVLSDVRHARSAGNIFVYGEELYRPSQNGARFYGHSMNISKIVTLNENVYQEQLVSNISPNWHQNVEATHTLNFDGNLTVIDAMVKRRKIRI